MTRETDRIEGAPLAALPRERQPSRLLEERTVAALKAEGLLGRRRPRPAGGWLAAGIAASLACFLGGLSVGQSLGARQTADVVGQVRAADAQQVAAIVQQAGTAYIAALARLGVAVEAADPSSYAAGREVALNAFWAAAGEVARIAPDDPLVSLMLQAQDQPPIGAADERPPRHVVWF
jgi:hypothetical protein